LIPHFWHLEHEQQHQEKKRGKQWNEEEKENLEAKGPYPSFLLYVGCGKSRFDTITDDRTQAAFGKVFLLLRPTTDRQTEERYYSGLYGLRNG
jgi:hypothetical protein